MNKLLIYEYIKKLRHDDIINYCNKLNIDINNNDVDIIYDCIKNDYKTFFDNPMFVLNNLKNKVSDNTFKEIINLYDKYKNKMRI